jgi:hypothetical protein
MLVSDLLLGYVYHEQYKYEWSEFSMGGQSYRLPWKWLSFPRLPVDPEDQYNEGQNVNASEIRWHWNDTPDSCAWYYHGGSATPWFYGLDQDSDEYFDYWSGNDPCTDSLSSLKGYKIYAPESGCSLFTRGKKCEDDTEISTLKNYDTWIGYFILDTQTAEDAFPDSLLDYCTKIQTQRWCTSRATTNDPWSKDLDDCYLNYTDMVVLFTTTGCDFSWNSSRDNTEPVIRPYAEHFDWEEEIDYLPVYVEFDPQDIPNEIGVYVGGECQGAEVVDDLICQICSYILFEEPGQEIEFEFWYEGRGERERKDCYQIHENGFPVTSNTLFTGQPGDFYTLSFNKDDPLEPVPYNFCCYPNPFNPETTISFSLLQESEVELAVYNIKGQRTKTLVDETFRPDTYNIIWQADNDKGNKVSSGVYFIKLKIGKEILTEKVILLK